jgi:two-component system response regulator DesR
MIRVLLVEDHQMFREGTRALLSDAPEIEVVAGCGRGEDALALIEALAPDIVLLDIELEGMSGLQVARCLSQQGSAAKVIILSAYAHETYVRILFAAGVHGYLLKKASSHELIEAVRAVHGGGQVYSPEVAARQSNVVARSSGATAPLVTERELAVLCLVRDGLNNREIGETLQISLRTVESYLSHAMAKLGARSRTEAVNLAVRTGVLGDG